MKGFVSAAWRVYESYKTYLATNILIEYLRIAENDQMTFLNDYEKNLMNLEKKLMVTLEDKVLSGLVHEFVARNLISDVSDAFIQSFEVFFAEMYS